MIDLVSDELSLYRSCHACLAVRSYLHYPQQPQTLTLTGWLLLFRNSFFERARRHFSLGYNAKAAAKGDSDVRHCRDCHGTYFSTPKALHERSLNPLTVRRFSLSLGR